MNSGCFCSLAAQKLREGKNVLCPSPNICAAEGGKLHSQENASRATQIAVRRKSTDFAVQMQDKLNICL